MDLSVSPNEFILDMAMLRENIGLIDDTSNFILSFIEACESFTSEMKGTAIEGYIDELYNMRFLMQTYYNLLNADCTRVEGIVDTFLHVDGDMASTIG